MTAHALPVPLTTPPNQDPSPRTSTSSYSSDNDNTDLPFPTPLPRSDFLVPAFDPSTYLSSLGSRHQTLEDLRADLRQRSQVLSAELLELVNARYEDFLSLGSSVRGGGEKAEELRVGLLALRREIEVVRGAVAEREREMEGLVRERGVVRREVERGRRLVEWEGRVGRLEERLGIESGANGDGRGEQDEGEDEDEGSTGDEDDEDEDEGMQGTVPLPRLARRVEEVVAVERAKKIVGERHPFVVAQGHRIMKIRNVLLLDLSAAVRAAKGDGERMMRLLELYSRIGAAREAVETLKRVGR